MKRLSLISGALLVVFALTTTTTTFTSCQKETITDTVYVKDTITLPCNCDEESLKKGLVAYYNFNNGTLKDSSGKNNHIIFNTATPTADRYGRPNNAYRFDGSTSYMRVANSVSLNPLQEITMMAVIKVNDWYSGTCHGNILMTKSVGGYPNGHYDMIIDDQICSGGINPFDMRLHASYNDRAVSPTTVVPDTVRINKNQWYTLVASINRGDVKIYVNGVLKLAYKASSFSFTPNSNDLFIGRLFDTQYPYWFNGVMDEVRIYERALCPDQVKKLSESTL